MDYERARFNMVEQQIRPWDVLDQDVLDLLMATRREDFVSPAYRGLAFSDLEVPIAIAGKPSGETMLSPKVEGRILQALALKRHESVLLIGAGSGYLAALMSYRARKITAIEIHPEIAKLAQANIKNAGIHNMPPPPPLPPVADREEGLPPPLPPEQQQQQHRQTPPPPYEETETYQRRCVAQASANFNAPSATAAAAAAAAAAVAVTAYDGSSSSSSRRTLPERRGFRGARLTIPSPTLPLAQQQQQEQQQQQHQESVPLNDAGSQEEEVGEATMQCYFCPSCGIATVGPPATSCLCCSYYTCQEAALATFVGALFMVTAAAGFYLAFAYL